MCGIFLALSKNDKKLSKTRCKHALTELKQRGPDITKYEFFNSNKLFLANTVLSITGKTSKSNKLISTNDRKLLIAFNGEIYNYKHLQNKYLSKKKFENDTEVLCNLNQKLNYEKTAKALDGMFAYVLLNRKDNKITIVTDVQGEKNLYYYNDENLFIVSSTVKSILKYIGKYHLDQNTLKQYLQTRHFMSIRDTSFKNIKIFPNGSLSEYEIKLDKLKTKIYESPISWISKKKYNFLKKLTEEQVLKKFDKLLNDQAKLMLPSIKYGSIVSGGIDSSLQAIILNQYKTSSHNVFVDHYKKDPISKKIKKFNKYFLKKIITINMNKKIYQKIIGVCYKICSSPLFTHELPSRYLISKKFKDLNCKVFFSADGCDELLGGQQIYLKSFSGKYNYKFNQSPYTTFFYNLIKTKNLKDEFLIQSIWKKVLTKYKFIKNDKEKNIQSSLFLDYFVQSVFVANRSNDLISCENSVEPRNIFIQKKILKFIINLPLKYKIKYNSKNKIFIQKYLLKKIFIKYFNKRLVFQKSGFSGFPSQIKMNYKNEKKKIENLFETKFDKNIPYYDRKNYFRDIYWKILNLSMFIKIFGKIK